MIVRGLDANGDWLYGKGRNDYKTGLNAIAQSIQTRLSSFFGDCFFNLNAGLDWFNLLGSKNEIALQLAINSTILNTENVTGILELSVNVDDIRNITIKYNVQTTLGQLSNAFQYDLGT